MAKTPKAQMFRTVEDMHAIPLEKIDHFCQDLALWLSLHRVAELTNAEQSMVKVTSPRDVFGWVDDGKHDVNLNIKLHTEPQQ
jgi:hypothetical protein